MLLELLLGIAASILFISTLYLIMNIEPCIPPNYSDDDEFDIDIELGAHIYRNVPLFDAVVQDNDSAEWAVVDK